MRILYLTAGFPFPLTSGYLRHHHLIRQLAPNHRVKLFSLVGRGFEPAHAEAMAPLVAGLRTFATITPGRSSPAKLAGRASALAGGAANDGERAMAAAVRAEIDAGEVDVVLLSGKRTFPTLGSLGDVPLVVDLCDATSSRLRGGLRYADPLRRADQALQYLAMRRVEAALVELGDHLLFASDRDRRLVLGDDHWSASVSVVPNGVDLDHWRRRTDHLGPDVVFSGAMHYGPNEQAARHLAEAVMPKVWARRPETRLVLVGKEPSARLQEAARHPQVVVTGFVDDVRTSLEQAAVFAAPLQFGVGIQNKLLEAMAMEVPVITSSLAAEGVHLDGAPPLAIADDPAGMADLILDRLAAAALDPTPDRSARSWLTERFDWARSGAVVEAALRRVTGAAAREAVPC